MKCFKNRFTISLCLHVWFKKYDYKKNIIEDEVGTQHRRINRIILNLLKETVSYDFLCPRSIVVFNQHILTTKLVVS